MYLLKSLSFLAVLVFGIANTLAQTVDGMLVDEQNRPLAFANVVLLSLPDSVYYRGELSADNGLFQFDGIKKGHYLLKISYLGYQEVEQELSVEQTDVRLGTVAMKDATVALSEVTVMAGKPLVYSRGGSMITDVANSSLRNAGTAKEVMKHIPGVIALKDKYEVFGKGSPIIYINNKKMRNDNELLMLKSTDILSVEVISNPGVGYDADTRAVVKIITRKKRGEGFMAQVDAEGALSTHLSHNEGVSLSYQKGGLNVFGSYRFDCLKEDIRYDVTQISYEQNAVYNEESSSKYTDRGKEHSFSVGMNYDINDKQSVGLQYVGYAGNVNIQSGFDKDWIKMYEDGSLFVDNRNALKGNDDSRFDNVNVYYQIKATDKFSIQAEADYVRDWLDSHECIEEMSSTDNHSETTNTYSENNSRVYAAKGEFDYHFNDSHSLKWGIDYSLVNVGGQSHNPEGKIEEDVYENQENKYAVFAQYQLSWGNLLGEVGVRYEFVKSKVADFGKIIDERKYSDVLPSLSLSLPVGNVDFSLNFSNRLQRPSFGQLNNKVKYNNQFHQERGNPKLRPQKIYDVDLSMKYSIVSLRLNYQYINDYIYTTAERSDVADGASVWFTSNAPKYQLAGAMLVASQALGCWRPTLTVGVYKPFLTLDYLDKPLDYNKPYGLFSFQNEITLPKNFVIRADVQWNTKGNRGVYYMKGFGYSELALQKSFFDDNLNLALRGEDLFNWSKTQDTKILNYLVSDRTTNSYGRKVVFSVSWNFNNFKTKYRGTGAGNDEKSRL